MDFQVFATTLHQVEIRERGPWSFRRAIRDWEAGPLPFGVRESEDGPAVEVPADSTWHLSHLSPRVAKVLVGPGKRALRLHRRTEGSENLTLGGASFRIVGLELLVEGRRRRHGRVGVLVTHIELESPLWTMARDASTTRRIAGAMKLLSRDLQRSESGRVSWRLPKDLSALVGPRIRAAEGYRNALLHVLLSPGAGPGAQGEATSDLDGELWALAMATPVRDPRVPEDESEQGCAVVLPRAVVRVVKHGIVQLGRDTGDPHSLDSGAGVHLTRFRTIYLDGLLLVAMQQRLLDRITNEAAYLRDPMSRTWAFRQLSRDFREFRVIWWWRDFSRWGQPDRIVRAIQDEMGLEEAYDTLRDDQTFFANMRETAQTTRLNQLLIGLGVLSLTGIVPAVIEAVPFVPPWPDYVSLLIPLGSAAVVWFLYVGITWMRARLLS